MVTNAHEITFHGVEPDEVFAWVADLDGWHRWRPSAGRLEQVTPGPVGVGTTWQAGGRLLDQDIAVTVEVTALEPGVRFGLLVEGSIQAEETFSLEPVTEGTRLTMTLQLAAPQLAEPADRRPRPERPWRSGRATPQRG